MLHVYSSQGSKREYYGGGTRYLHQEKAYLKEAIGRVCSTRDSNVLEYMARLTVRPGTQTERTMRLLRMTGSTIPVLFTLDERAWRQIVKHGKSIENIRTEGSGKIIERPLGHIATLGSEVGLHPFETIQVDIAALGEVKIQDGSLDGVDVYARWPESMMTGMVDTSALLGKVEARIFDHPRKRLS